MSMVLVETPERAESRVAGALHAAAGKGNAAHVRIVRTVAEALTATCGSAGSRWRSG